MIRFLIFLCILIRIAEAQNTRLSEHNSIGWYVMNAGLKLSDSWKVVGEYQFRRNELGKSWQQSLARTGLQYQFTSQLKLRAGYGWIVTYPYGEYPLNSLGKTYPEHRIYQAVLTESNSGKVRFSNRYMLEQRFVGSFAHATDTRPSKYIYMNRARVQVRAETNLFFLSDNKRRVYVAAWDEVFIGFGKNVKENVFDQNRIALIAGIQPSPHFKIEGGYFNQIVQLGREIHGQNVFQYNTGMNLSGTLEF